MENANIFPAGQITFVSYDELEFEEFNQGLRGYFKTIFLFLTDSDQSIEVPVFMHKMEKLEKSKITFLLPSLGVNHRSTFEVMIDCVFGLDDYIYEGHIVDNDGNIEQISILYVKSLEVGFYSLNLARVNQDNERFGFGQN